MPRKKSKAVDQVPEGTQPVAPPSNNAQPEDVATGTLELALIKIDGLLKQQFAKFEENYLSKKEFNAHVEGLNTNFNRISQQFEEHKQAIEGIVARQVQKPNNPGGFKLDANSIGEMRKILESLGIGKEEGIQKSEVPPALKEDWESYQKERLRVDKELMGLEIEEAKARIKSRYSPRDEWDEY